MTRGWEVSRQGSDREVVMIVNHNYLIVNHN